MDNLTNISSLYKQIRLTINSHLTHFRNANLYGKFIWLFTYIFYFISAYLLTHFITEYSCKLTDHGLLKCPNFEMEYFMSKIYKKILSILQFLKESPFGIKLQKQLTNFLVAFFLEHLYLWKNILLHLKYTILNDSSYLVFILYLNLPLTLSILNDVIKFICIPIEVLFIYTYKSLFIVLKIIKLFGLLFLGKDWNPQTLTNSSVALDMDQLLISTILLTILLFLLPTLIVVTISICLIRLPLWLVNNAFSLAIHSLNTIQLSMVTYITDWNLNRKNKIKPFPMEQKNNSHAINEWLNETIILLPQ